MRGEVQFGVSAVEDTTQSAPAATARRPSAGRVLRAVFGPRPSESVAWGAGLGFVFGLPLVLGYFVAHYAVMEFALIFGGDQLADDVANGDAMAILFGAGFGAMMFSFVGLVGIGLLVARLRQANPGTILLVGYLVSFGPYIAFFLSFVSA